MTTKCLNCGREGKPSEDYGHLCEKCVESARLIPGFEENVLKPASDPLVLKIIDSIAELKEAEAAKEESENGDT